MLVLQGSVIDADSAMLGWPWRGAAAVSTIFHLQAAATRILKSDRKMFLDEMALRASDAMDRGDSRTS